MLFEVLLRFDALQRDFGGKKKRAKREVVG